MATPRKKAEQPERSKDYEAKKKLLARVRERYKVMAEADDENRREGLEDLKFVNVPGYQWDANMKKERGNRPCLEFNKLRINGKRVINEIRANRPQGKVRAVEGGDKEIAELYEGLCRNIANISDFDTITDQAAEYQVDAGMGAWRIDTEYAGDSAFDQDILIRPIKNPFCLYADPACQDVMKRDAEDWILTERISNKAFEARYGKVEKIDFNDGEFDDEDEWSSDETVRIVEYWYKEPHEKEIWLIQGPNGPITVDAESDEAAALKAQGVEPLNRRKVRAHKIMMCVASGDAVLEGPVKWAGSQFPFVMVYGEYKVVDGKVKWWGLHRFAKDAQKSYNTSRTSIDETIAGAPKEYFWATPEQAKGNVEQWGEAHRKNYPFKLYNPDGKAPGPPVAVQGAAVPVALLQQAEVAAADIRDVTGLHEASFGEESSEKSGIALARKQNQAQVVTYNFPDNMAKGVRRTWEILIDLIPHIYDAERELRVIGADGAEDYKRVNQIVQDPKTGQTVRVNDITHGKYDVTVTTGPSFSTLRQEAAETYGEIIAKFPNILGVAGDLLMKSMDLPYAEEIAKRMQTLLPPQIQEQIAEGKDIPPEVQAVMAKAEQAMQIVQQQTQLVQQAAAEVEKEKQVSEKQKAEVEKAIANLKTAEAQFEAKVAQVEAQFVQREANLGMQSQQISGEKQALDGERKMFQTEAKMAQQQNDAQTADLSEAKQAVAEIDEMVAQFMELVASATQKLEGLVAEIKNKPKIKAVHLKRDKTGTRAEPEYEAAPAG